MPVGRQGAVRPRRRDRRRAVALLSAGVLVVSAPVLVPGSASGVQGSAINPVGSDGYWSSVSLAGGPNSNTYGYSVAVTRTGTSIIAGRFNRTAYFPTSADDSIALTSLGGDEAYVAELDSAGAYFLWAQRAGGSGHDAANEVSVSSGGVPIVTGYFAGTAYFPTSADDSIALTSVGNDDVFVAALNTDDSYFDWVQRAGGAGSDSGKSVGMTRDDTPIITGGFEGTAYFPTSPDDSIALTSLGGNDMFVAALNTDDSYFAWAQRAGGSESDYAESVAVARDNTTVVAGIFRGTTYFPTSPDDSISMTASGDGDLFVAALNTDDSYFAWAQHAGGSSTGWRADAAWSVALTRDDTPIVTGNFTGTAYFPTSADDSIVLTSSSTNDDLFVGALNADDSYFAWVQRAGGASFFWAEGWSVAVTRDDTPVVTGRFGGTVSFPTRADDSITLTSSSEDIFVAALNADDTYFAWVQLAGGAGFDFGASVALTADDTPIVTGHVSGTAYFPSSEDDSISRTASGWNDLFVGFLGGGAAPAPGPGPSPGPTPDPAPAPVYSPSAPRDVVGVAGDASAVVLWSPPASSGSFPVSDYQVLASPGGASCMAKAPAQSCTVTGLTNGTAYTFRVRALNGAGWGVASEPSNVVLPQAPVALSIQIAGSRDTGDPRLVRVTGITTGLVGEQVTPWTRFAGQRAYTAGLRSPIVGSDGTFGWSRRAGKTLTVYFAHADVKSNAVVIGKR